MGIPKFFGWFSHQEIFRPALINRAPAHTDIFALDLNGLIHLNAQKVFGYGEFPLPPEQIGVIIEKGRILFSQQEFFRKQQQVFQGVFRDIVGLTQTIRPRQSLIIAVDGVAPQAKINQQRNRRYKSAAERKPEQVFDSNAITPGTNFMRDFDTYMRQELDRIANIDRRARVRDPYAEALPPHIVYSSHLTPGEGEHKIADLLRDMQAQDRTAVIYGADADLIMIYLIHLRNGWDNIYLFRENKRNYHVRTMIDLKILETVIQQLYPGVPAPTDDFVTMLFLNGNDFLPHFPIFERVDDALNTLIGGYSQFLQANPGKGLTSGTSINWENFGLFIQFISDNYSNELLKRWAENRDIKIKFPSIVVEKCTTERVVKEELKGTMCVREFDPSRFKSEWYQYIFSPKTGVGVIVPTDEDKNRIVEHYLEGITWVYNYYRYGQSGVNVGWYYPYHYAPIFADLHTYILGALRDPEVSGGITWKTSPIHFHSEFVSPLEQIIMVLPPGSLISVPEAIRTLYSEASPIYDILPESFLIDPQGKMEEWQAIAILPIPNPVRVIRAVDSLNLPGSYIQIYSTQENLIINRDIARTFGMTERPRRGRGRYQSRGTRGRGKYQPRGTRGRGRYQSRGTRDRGRYQPRSTRGRGERRQWRPRSDQPTFSRNTADFRRTLT